MLHLSVYHQVLWTFNKICTRLCFLAWMVSFLSRIYTLLYTYFYYWHHENTSLLCLNLGVNLIVSSIHRWCETLRKQILKLLLAWTIFSCPFTGKVIIIQNSSQSEARTVFQRSEFPYICIMSLMQSFWLCILLHHCNTTRHKKNLPTLFKYQMAILISL